MNTALRFLAALLIALSWCLAISQVCHRFDRLQRNADVARARAEDVHRRLQQLELQLATKGCP